MKKKNNFNEIKRTIRMNPIIAKVKTVLIILLLGALFFALKVAGTDYNIECTKSNDICTISTSDFINKTPVPISRFDTARIADAFVETRQAKDGTVIYDILLDYGPYVGKVFIDYGFNTKIKANTVKMKLLKYINGSDKTLSVTKHCYFNNYFCY